MTTATLRTTTYVEATDGSVRHMCCGELEGRCTCPVDLSEFEPPDSYDLEGLARARGESAQEPYDPLNPPDAYDLKGLEAKRRVAGGGR